MSNVNLFLFDHSGWWWGPCLSALVFLVGALLQESSASDQVAELLVGDGWVFGISKQAGVKVIRDVGEKDVLAFLFRKLYAGC